MERSSHTDTLLERLQNADNCNCIAVKHIKTYHNSCHCGLLVGYFLYKPNLLLKIQKKRLKIGNMCCDTIKRFYIFNSRLYMWHLHLLTIGVIYNISGIYDSLICYWWFIDLLFHFSCDSFGLPFSSLCRCRRLVSNLCKPRVKAVKCLNRWSVVI